SPPPSTAVPARARSETDTHLFVLLDPAIAPLNTPVEGNDVEKEKAAAAIDKTNRGLKNSLINVLTVRAELGTQLSELSTLDSLGSDRALGQKLQ
ncbi:flagellar hook-filament junction protein FlgL, partial [Salmonella enterica subsp. enterica serovar Wilhelmsburg]